MRKPKNKTDEAGAAQAADDGQPKPLNVAQLYGVLSRVHGALRLPGEDPEQRIRAIEAWCETTEQRRLAESPQERMHIFQEGEEVAHGVHG